MADINHVVLIGRLTRDAELKSMPSGQAVCKFSIAVNRRKKNGDQWEDEASFFDIVVWGKQGETLHQYLVKGKMVGIEGELRQDRWQQDGQNRSKVEIVSNYVQLLGGNPGGSSGGYSSGGSASPERQNWHGQSAASPPEQSGPAYSGPQTDDGFVDDIPF
jgi:single-strand DNA-binding protein